MESIIRYWIILPECTVEYIEDGKSPEKIGFASVRDALEHFHFLDAEDISLEAVEFLTKSAKASEVQGQGTLNASYELAFAISKHPWFPERNFALRRNKSAPAVCIEGIRVADACCWVLSPTRSPE